MLLVVLVSRTRQARKKSKKKRRSRAGSEDVVHRAFVLDMDTVRQRLGCADHPAQRLGLVYVEIDKDIEMNSDLIEELQGIADIS